MTGRKATTNVIPGDVALSVGMPDRPPPDGWQWVSLDKVATMATGHTPSRKKPEYWGGDVKWMAVKDARPNHGGTIYETKERTNPLGISKSAAVLLPKGTVCLSRTGSIGYSVLLGDEMATSQGFVNWICSENLLPRFLQLIFFAENSFLHRISEGVAHTTIYFPEVKAFHVCIPPIEVQRIVIAEIEKQFSRLDIAITNLKRVKANLKRYKAAVLKAAVEGKLTEEWRTQNPDVEPASKLLERILAERRTKWEEAELAKMKAKGKEPKNEKWKDKYKEPTVSSEATGSSVPVSWVLATVEQLAAVGTGATPLKSNNTYYDNGDIPWVTSGALNDDFVMESEDFVTQLALEETNVKLFPVGSLLVAMYGEGKTRGKVSELLIEATTNQACAALIFYGLSSRLKDYVKLYFQKNYDDLRRLSSGGVQPNLNLGLIKETKVPLPPTSEQLEIFGEVEQKLSVIAALESQLSADIARADRLRQSILANAFSGGNSEVTPEG